MIDNAFDQHKLGIALIDEQHHDLYKLLKGTHSLTDNKVINDRLEIFLDKLKLHFKDEEEFMESIQYPAIVDHKQTHHILLENLCELGIRNELNILENGYLFNTLKNIIVHHMDGDDKQMALFYKNSLCHKQD